MIIEWLLVILKEARKYVINVLNLVFRPSAYVKTISIGNKDNFHRSMSFYLGSMSVYVTLCGIFLLFDAGNVTLKNLPPDILAFVKVLIRGILTGLLFFLPVFILTRRTFSLTDFLHSYAHVSVAGFYLSLATVALAAVFLPPVSDQSHDFIVRANIPGISDVFSDVCRCDRDTSYCRVIGAVFDWMRFVVGQSAGLEIRTFEEIKPYKNLSLFSYYFYIIAFSLLVLL